MNFAYGVIVGIVLYFIYLYFTKQKTSNFQSEVFPDTLSSEEASELYKKQSNDLAAELAGKLKDAMQANSSHEDMTTLSWQYADMANQVNKTYAAYKIRQLPVGGTPAP